MIVFSRDWFELHQRKLLRFANSRLGRYVLRIHGKRSSVGYNRITKLEPNAITWRNEDGSYSTEYRTHAKYSKRLYHAFKPLWYTAHAWDMAIANNLNQALNLGFDSLTSYPDAHPEITTVDGTVRRSNSNSSWPSLVGGAGTSAEDTATVGWAIGIAADHTNANKWSLIQRSIYLFDTSSIPDGSTVSDATLSLRGQQKNDVLAISPDINIFAADVPSSDTALVAADYDTIVSDPFATAITYAGWSTSGYNDFALNALGIAAVSKTGISRFGARNENYDYDNVVPSYSATNQVSLLGCYFADNTGTTSDPKLLVNYVVAYPVEGTTTITMSGTMDSLRVKVIEDLAGSITMSGVLASAATRIETNPSRKIVQSTQLAWKKAINNSYRLFTIGVSSIGGGDYINSSGGTTSDWNNYFYQDESDKVLMLDYERELKLPLGGLTKAIGDVRLDNTSGRYTPSYMGGNSELFTAVQKPRRPIIINAGFHYNGVDNMQPQFVGITTKAPKIDVRSRTVDLHFADFNDFLQNRYVDRTTMYTGIRSDVFIGNILSTLGYSTAQYELDTGINILPFILMEDGKKYSDIIDEVAIAENAHVFQDETGKIRFENRQRWNSAPYTYIQRIITTSMVLDAQAPSDDHIINAVEIRSSVREKQSTATIYTLQVPIQLDIGVNEVFINFDDPVLAASAPVITANSQQDGSGSNVSGSVSVSRTDLFAQAIKYRINNASGSVAYITAMTIQGRVASVTEEIYYREVDGSSRTAYEEQPIIIENDYISSRDWARSYARIVLDDFSDPEKLQKITIRAIPALKMGDLISWQGRSWRIYGIKTTISPDVGFLQELSLLQRDIITYFRIGVSLIGGPDKIAS